MQLIKSSTEQEGAVDHALLVKLDALISQHAS